MIALWSIAPVMILISLGILARKLGLLEPSSMRNLNALLYWICLPALLFHKVQALEFQIDQVAPFFWSLLLASLASIFTSALLAVFMRLPGPQRAAFMQAGFRGNLAFVGLPVALFYLQARGLGTPELEGQIFLVLAPGILIYNVFGVVLLASADLNFSKAAWSHFARQLAGNPLILSVLLGLIWGELNWPVGMVFDKTLGVLSAAVLPLALMGVGASADFSGVKQVGRLPVIAAVIKCFVTPFYGYWIARVIGLSQEEQRILVILLIAPTAAAAYIMAQQMGADEKLTSQAIVLSVLVSLVAYLGSLSLL
ncbi:MAG: AEC family transporter [bacterium]|nr:AEC family transporter [bacterium]